MKEILGHRSWNKAEVIAFLRKSGTFTMCRLPHYRYRHTQMVCNNLRKKGWIEKSGITDQAVNWRATEAFKQWAFLDGSDLV